MRFAATTHFGGFAASGVPGAITKRDAARALRIRAFRRGADVAEKAGEDRLVQVA